MIDVAREIDAIGREVGRGQIAAGEGHSVTLRRTYDASIEDVWDALTNPYRIGRWFLPISGDYRLGRRYQFEGNAGGEILACERPSYLKATWVFGAEAEVPDSLVEVRLSSVPSGKTRVDFLHTAVVPDDRWDEYGPGAVGVGWDLAMIGLGQHLEAGVAVDHEAAEAWTMSDEGKGVVGRISSDWARASIAAGTDEAAAWAAAERTTAFYTEAPSE